MCVRVCYVLRSQGLIFIFIYLSFNFCSDSVLRNDSTRLIQPEVIFRTDGNGQTPGINSIGNGAPMDRKGAVAIGQSVFYTEYPPQDYGVSGKRIFIIHFRIFYIWIDEIDWMPFRQCCNSVQID